MFMMGGWSFTHVIHDSTLNLLEGEKESPQDFISIGFVREYANLLNLFSRGVSFSEIPKSKSKVNYYETVFKCLI